MFQNILFITRNFEMSSKKKKVLFTRNLITYKHKKQLNYTLKWDWSTTNAVRVVAGMDRFVLLILSLSGQELLGLWTTIPSPTA